MSLSWLRVLGRPAFFGASLMSTTFFAAGFAAFGAFSVFSAAAAALGGLRRVLSVFAAAHCRRSSMSFTAPEVISTLS